MTPKKICYHKDAYLFYMNLSWLQAILVIISTAGLFLAAYIYQKKHGRRGLMVCPLRFDCHTVIYSQHSVFMGLPNEVMGMLYYGFVALSYLAMLVWPQLATGLLGFFLLFATTLAFLFSLYLTALQIFVIRKLCSLCLTSALLSGIILWLTMMVSQVDVVTMLAQYRPIILILHVLGVTLGLGGATLTDIFFFRFIRDLRISHAESEVLHTISQVIWFAIGMLVVTGIGLFIPESERLLASSKFLAKFAIVIVLILNGAALHYIVAPKLVRISFGIRHIHQRGELHRLRKLAYALGAISIISWYATFILGMMQSLPMSAYLIFGAYAACVVVGIAISQLIDLKNTQKSE